MTTPPREPLKITRISSESSGTCPRCGVGRAHPYAVEGLDGYFDSCADCKQQVAEDALADQKGR